MGSTSTLRRSPASLSVELESFLNAGEAPVYFGLDSTHAVVTDISQMMVKVARSLRRRAVISRGWAGLPLPDDGDDCLLIGEANHQALFSRVAAVVHHGGAGTTTVARAGVPQVVLPQIYDQHYWRRRVEHLGIGVARPQGVPTTDSLTTALRQVLGSDFAARAHAIATAMGIDSVRTDGAQAAAQRLMGSDRPGIRGRSDIRLPR